MKHQVIQIPQGLKKIEIDIEHGTMKMHYADEEDSKYIDCEETGDSEERPGIGDFAIFWEKEDRGKACCANFVQMSNGLYEASDTFLYDEAIKFRNYEQFLRVRGVYE